MDSKRAMEEAVQRFKYEHRHACYPDAMDFEARQAVEQIIAPFQSAFAEELAGMEAEIARLRQRVAVLEFEANGPPADGTPISIFDLPHRKP